MSRRRLKDLNHTKNLLLRLLLSHSSLNIEEGVETFKYSIQYNVIVIKELRFTHIVVGLDLNDGCITLKKSEELG